MVGKPKIRILAIADSVLNFEPNKEDSLDLALSTVTQSARYEFDIVRHHMSTPTLPNLDDFQQVWLFGRDDSDQSNPDVTYAITRFMMSGGGVFATGDHKKLGRKLCGDLPRLRYMRSWEEGKIPKRLGFPKLGAYPTPAGERYNFRLDSSAPKTFFTPRGTPDDRFLEYDCVPKSIEARLLWGSASPSPHPVVRMSDDTPLRVLPDHAHEGACFDLGSTDKPIPGFSDAKPEVIADAYTYSGMSIRTDYVQVSQQYGVISVYDPPKRNGWGRIVTDSTFHHWVNKNVQPFKDAAEVDELGAQVWRSIKQYYLNVADWLVPRYIRAHLLKRYVEYVIAHTDVRNSIAGLDLAKEDQRILVAREVLGELDRRYRRSIVAELVEDVIADSVEEAEAYKAFGEELAKLRYDHPVVADAVYEALIVEVISSMLTDIDGMSELGSPVRRALSGVQHAVNSLGRAWAGR